MTKYGASKTTVDGHKFDSKREALRYCELKLLEKAGQITGLQMQIPFELAPAVKINERKKPALRYYADFIYFQNGQMIIEDVKGHLTDVYRIKRHLMAVKGLTITEV